MRVWVWQEGGTVFPAQKAFEQDLSRDLIDEVFAAKAIGCTPTLPVSVEQTVSLVCCQTLVKEMVLKGGVVCKESLGECESLGRLTARGAVHMQRVAYHQHGYLMASNKPRDGFQVCVQRFAVQGEQRLRQELKRV